MKIEIELKNDNTEAILHELSDKVSVALEMCGMQAESYAKMKCPVDTGLLRNSMTHALSGQNISKIYHASKGSNRNNKGNRISASSKNAGAVKMGTISGTEGTASDQAVYVGTNVEYAPYVEMGTSRQAAQPFLKPAFEDHISTYKRIMQSVLQS